MYEPQARLLSEVPTCSTASSGQGDSGQLLGRLATHPQATSPSSYTLPGWAFHKDWGSTDNKGQCHGNGHLPGEIFCLASFLH